MKFVENIESKNVAKKIANWEYPSPYDIYNMNGDKETIKEILNEDYYSYIYNDLIIGYFCYGDPAQVPTENSEIYADDEFLDIGVGLNPKLCGEGRGYNFFSKAVDAAFEIYEIKKYRLTVAKFNERAIKVYLKYGFREENEFQRDNDGKKTNFITMTFN